MNPYLGIPSAALLFLCCALEYARVWRDLYHASRLVHETAPNT